MVVSDLMKSVLPRLTKNRLLSIAAAIVIGTLSLSSCGSVTAKASTASLPQLKSPGPVTTQVNIKLSKSTPASFSSGSSPNVIGTGLAYISPSGFIVATQASGNESDIYERSRPTAPWVRPGTVPGIVAQLDFATSELGFALVQGAGGQSSSLFYATTNGGRNWNLVSAGQLDPGSTSSTA